MQEHVNRGDNFSIIYFRLGQTCNHVASLLFRVEAANRFGIASCTSRQCKWDVPKDTKSMEPALISSMNFKKSSRTKTGELFTLQIKSLKLLSLPIKTNED